MSYNASKGSQSVSPDFRKSFPEVSEAILKDEAKGDFIALAYRQDVDAELEAMFNYHWQQNNQDTGNKS